MPLNPPEKGGHKVLMATQKARSKTGEYGSKLMTPVFGQFA